MSSLPSLALTPPARNYLRRQLAFIATQSSGKPADRRREIRAAFERIQRAPLARPVSKRSRVTGLEFRRYSVNQFVIIYVYFEPDESRPNGLVSIRAVRHRRERDVLFGVRETDASRLWPPLQTRDAPGERRE